jgi:signal transduction histidine kinase
VKSRPEVVLRPCYHVNAARGSMGGFGLGLTIAFDVVPNRSSTLTLNDRSP